MDLIAHIKSGGKVALRHAPDRALEVKAVTDGGIYDWGLSWQRTGEMYPGHENPFDLIPHQPADDDGWDPWVEIPEGADAWEQSWHGKHRMYEVGSDDFILRYRLRKPAQTPAERVAAAYIAWQTDPTPAAAKALSDAAAEAAHHAEMRAKDAETSPTGGL